MLIDLQLHSTYSDGYYSPQKLVKMLASHQVKVASLTDHNSLFGQAEFFRACRQYRIKAIPGLELYVKHKQHRFSLLWYNFLLDSPDLHNILAGTWKKRIKNISRGIDRLAKQGFKFDLEKFCQKHPGYLPINHLIGELWLNSHNRRLIKQDLQNNNPLEEEIIRHYFYPKHGSRLPESYVSFKRIVDLRKKIGGQLILAHPTVNRKLKNNILVDLKEAGLDGIEVLSPHHNYSNILQLANLAQKFDFIASGGSDFHLPRFFHFGPRFSWQWFKIDSRYLRRINQIIN